MKKRLAFAMAATLSVLGAVGGHPATAEAVGSCTPIVFADDNVATHRILQYDTTSWNSYPQPPSTNNALTYPDIALDGANSTLYGVRSDGSLDVINFRSFNVAQVIRHVTPQFPAGLGPFNNVQSGSVLPGGTIAYAQGEQVYYINPHDGQVSPYFDLRTITGPGGVYSATWSAPGDFVTMPDGSLLALLDTTDNNLGHWGNASVLARITNGVGIVVATVPKSTGMARSGDYIYVAGMDGLMARYPLTSIPTTANETFMRATDFFQMAGSGTTNGYYGLAGTEDSTWTGCSYVGQNGFTANQDAYANTPARIPSTPGSIPSYTVTFNANGGSGGMSAQSGYSAAALSTNQFTRTGYTFAGWNTLANGAGTAYADGASYAFGTSAVLYAQWTPVQYTITYDLQGGAPNTPNENYNYAASVRLAPAVHKAGFNFQGWFLSASGGTALSTLYTPPTTAGNFTVYAQWTASTTPIVTPTSVVRPVGESNQSGIFVRSFQGNTSATSMTMTLHGMNAVTAQSSTSVSVDATGTACGSSGITIYQHATSVTVNCEVANIGGDTVLTLSGTTGTIGSHQYEFFIDPAAVTFTSSPVGGYKISTDFAGGGSSLGPQYDAALTGTWQLATFNSNDGQSLQTFELANQSSAFPANTFTLAGYSFAGWNTQANGQGTDYANQATYAFTSDISLYAQWSANTYAVSYNTQGGTAIPAGTYSTGSPIIFPGAPYKENAVFLGWFTSATGGTALGPDFAPDTAGDITIYAQWQELAVTGQNSTALGGLSLALVTAGLGVYAVSRRRSRGRMWTRKHSSHTSR